MSQIDTKRLLSWCVIFGVPLAVLLIPVNDVFTMQHKMFMAATAWAILMFAFELVDNYIPCIILPFLYIILGVADWSTAFSGWYKPIPWQVLGMFLFVNALLRNGFLKRVAYSCILATPCTYNGVLWGMFIFGVVFNLFLPGGSCVAMATFAYSVCYALGLKQSKTATGITLAGVVGYLAPGFFIYVPSNFGCLVSAAAAVDPTITLNFAKYFGHNAIWLLFGPIMIFVISKMFKPEVPLAKKDFFRSEKEALGKMSRDEIVSLFGLLVIFFFVLFADKLGIDSTYAFVLVPAILSFPVFGVVTKEDIQNINFSFVFFIVTCMSIGFVAAGCGVSSLIANMIVPIMTDMGTYGVIALTWVLGVLVNFCLTPLAAMSSLGGPLTEIALSLSMDPHAILYAFNQGLDQLLFPYEYAIYLVYFSFGMIPMKDFIKFGAVKMVLSFVFMMVAAVPFWMFVGLL